VAEAVARGEVPEEKDQGEGGDKSTDAGDTVLPMSRVKRIIKLDKDVKQASGEAIKCITKAVELFLEGLAVGSHAGMRAAKRKSVQYKDLESFILRRGKYEFLHDHIWAMRPKEGEKGEVDDDDDDEAPSAKKTKPVADANGSHRLTDYFKKGEGPVKIPSPRKRSATAVDETEVQEASQDVEIEEV